MKNIRRLILLVPALVALVACVPDVPPETSVEGRWYTHEQVRRGRDQFQQYCAACHGRWGEGLAENWKKPDANGNYPPPPLNGTAHTWHHSTDILLRTIENGGVPLGGVMPAFGSTLNEDEAREVIAYFQSLWPDEIYARWLEIENR
jgi:mono/diheme cytochrome c family protein